MEVGEINTKAGAEPGTQNSVFALLSFLNKPTMEQVAASEERHLRRRRLAVAGARKKKRAAPPLPLLLPLTRAAQEGTG